MKIKSLYIPDYYLLQDFNVEFSEYKNLAVIIGDNGSGKSSLLEVVAYIFGHLHKYFVLGDKTAEFIDGYEIVFSSIVNKVEYSVYLNSVYVRQKTNTFKPIIKINNEEVTISEIEKKYGGFQKFLPSRIGVYYAGEAQYLKKLSEHFENKYIKELIRKDNSYSLNPFNLPQERPFYYIKDNYLGFILLALIVNKDKSQNIDNLLNHLLGTIDYDQLQISINLRKPYWATSDKESLWGIESKFVNQFVEKLNDTAIQVKEENSIISYTYNGILDIKKLFKDSKKSDYAFMVLDTLYYNDLLESVIIDLKDEKGKVINSERLSEGQRQFIVTSGLAVLWEDIENKLFLYDEPDVFLHPKWQREYIPFLSSYFENSFALLTTHNPSILSDVSSSQVYLLRQGKIIEKGLNTYGEKFDRILIDYFGLEDTRNKNVSERFKSLYKSIKDKEFSNDKFKSKFDELKKIIGADDVDFILLNLELKRANEKN
ncbi:AAA family ATPase [Elizabethkingia anophelis]|uniref:AAA family ATPase n=1 Tax=Elizabethkingia anophelis TaxID=1117645 RepID=UPI0022264035|nr:AAA family ATPase [Elizabethkingia anophelis]MCW2465062.1 ABC-type cobalamin/Fe3+-siderophores transport system ATPase subunit [Elizabethkingia anophelis]MCW2468787.1 ABC-type cobalamin/Fe3+-siderophores transport system ATPase subunit [Elizabethkingia anophelis]MCW2472429.1 ABC-type cobalamin/Fe3+-siderophores transport system ATPase subunit [Elizabethkingia anophelis]HBI9693045.1 AAA family ATPase [Elizabethkingia anophelis]HBI9697065.1 AAA family ATPase [Elizabethkingia anophelis]